MPPPPRRRRLLNGLRRIAERCLGVRDLRDAYGRVTSQLGKDDGVDAFLDACLRELRVDADVPEGDVQRIPTSGPLLVVANHPHGVLDGLLLAALVRRQRPDLRILGNRWLCELPELRELLLDVDPLGGRDAARSNTSALRAAHRWLGGGGALLVFPAGKVSAKRWGRRGVHDDRWSPHIARLQQRAQASVLPIHIGGRNSALFQLAGLVHPRLRTLLIARETMRKRGSTVSVRIGNNIQPRQLQRFGNARELVDYLRLRTSILSRRDVAEPARARRGRRAPERIVAALPRATVEQDIASLPAGQLLTASGDFEVWYAWAPQAPSVMREIGRLREETFRKVGEGTDRDIDLDRFDPHYLHLFVWHRAKGYIVGAYRIGHVDKILIGNDERAFYTNTLYDYDARFLAHVTPGLELGRSFVVEAHQREFLPLLLLWRGIATYVARNPRYSKLFGAVSISDRHHDVSKRLMLNHLRRYMLPELGALVSPRHPVNVPAPAADGPQLEWTDAMVADLGDVSAMVAEIEAHERGVPVLLREYLKLGGRLVGLNVDPAFNHSITALVVIDLCETDPRVLSRYMGKAETAAFHAWHRRRRDGTALDCA